jgi:cyclase
MRKRPLNVALIFWLFIAVCILSGQTPSQESRHFTVQKLSGGVYAVIHKLGGHAICNAGIVDLGDRTLIFDTFISPIPAEELKEFAEDLTGNPIAFVINSHGHNDHVRGNQVFLPESSIIGTALMQATMAVKEPREILSEQSYAPTGLIRYRKAMEEERDPEKRKAILIWLAYFEALVESHLTLKTALPTITFEGQLMLHGTARSVELIEFRSAHSASDLVMILPEEKILFAGDLVFIKTHPYLADGNTDSLRSALKSLQRQDITTVVPGHGPVGGYDDIGKMIHYIEMIDRLVQQQISTGKNVSVTDVEAPFRTWGFPNFFTTSIKYKIEKSIDDVGKK